MFETLFGFLKAKDVKYDTNVRVADISPVGIGGPCHAVVWPRDIETLVCVVEFLENNQKEYKIVGRMTNLLVGDLGYDGVIIRTDALRGFRVDRNRVYVECGATMPYIARRVAELGLSGLEELSGIPGSIGGMIICNAGAYGRDTSDVLKSVTLLDRRSGEVKTVDAGEISFSYRHSSLSSGACVVIAATVELSFDDSEHIRRTMTEFSNMRRDSQPYGMRSLGSTFKRPIFGYASRMIDECGLKGYRIGGAEISDKHAGFIVNRGDATADDFLRLMTLARERVYERFGVVLEPEIEIL